ncbi:MAG: DNA translocase FtsK [Myxococcota bacterium]|nr:DNA translocase FtsK [Myxococcota bacterium]
MLCCVTAHITLGDYRPFAHTPGGVVGEWVGEIMRTLFATPGTLIISLSLLGASVLSLSGLSIREIAQLPARFSSWALRQVRKSRVDNSSESSASVEPATTPGRPLERQSRIQRFTGMLRPSWLSKKSDAPAEAALDTIDEDAETSEERIIPFAQENAAAPPATTLSPDSTSPQAAQFNESYAEVITGQSQKKVKAPKRSALPKDASTPKKAETTPESAFAPVRTEDQANKPAKRRREADKTDPGDAALEIAEPLQNTSPVIVSDRPAGGMPIVGDQKKLDFGGPQVFEFPSMSLLHYEAPARTAIDKEALSQAAVTLEQKLADFGVKGQVVKIQPGPVVTMFEFLPAPGIKISKITNLTDDLTMALHAQRVRIVAPIPGKGVVGIEVPSRVRETVYLKEILAAKEFQESRARLPISLGKDIVGKPMVADLAKAPHLLVAGSTGSGKSVAINAFIMSLLYRHKPSDLRMILVDPKMLELSVYDDIPHLLLPVVTDPNKASLALKWAVGEMERRYRLLAACAVRNITGFNAKMEKYRSGERKPPENIAEDELEHLPYIVIILDELADLMMVAGKEVEQSIARLAQMARAAGIHLVIATQRPSVDVVTGLIKANFPTRISFMVSSKIDSRTILDCSGAENLLGRGDMLFMPPGTSRLQRCQGCFVSDDEVERVAEHLKKFGPPVYDMNILADDDANTKDLSKEDYDPLFDQAVAVVCDTRNASISYLQRRLKIGYNRSARIIERMEHDGIISRPDHRGVRTVLAPEAAPE